VVITAVCLWVAAGLLGLFVAAATAHALRHHASPSGLQLPKGATFLLAADGEALNYAHLALTGHAPRVVGGVLFRDGPVGAWLAAPNTWAWLGLVFTFATTAIMAGAALVMSTWGGIGSLACRGRGARPETEAGSSW
jgi:hypothetical protein